MPIKTYSGRAKRQQTSTRHKILDSDSENTSDSENRTQAIISSAPMVNTTSDTRPLQKPQSKPINLSPPPSPKKISKSPSGKLTRATAKPYPLRKPSPSQVEPAVESPPISSHVDAPEDDNVSLPESAVGTSRARRTEAERHQILKDNAECGDIEPHRVHCLRCDKWISLGNRQAYALRSWDRHRVSCDRKPHHKDKQHTIEEGSKVVPNLVPPPSPQRGQAKSEKERQMILEQDPRAKLVKPYEVLCKKCKTWVTLSSSRRYGLGNWTRHQQICADAVPSSRVVAAESTLKLVNDKAAKSFTSQSVECASCGFTVSLDGEYVLVKWDEHKANCQGLNNPPENEVKATNSEASHSRQPPSTASDETLVSSAAGHAQGRTKRPRDDSDVEDGLLSKNRARTETYVKPNIDAPSVLGWFLLPFQSFLSGFREGLNRSSQ